MNKKLFAGTLFGLTAAGAAYAWYRSQHRSQKFPDIDVHGFVAPGFEGVRDAFVQNFDLRQELGAAFCVYRNGEKIVDLWGGLRDRATNAPWDEDTMVVVYSTTKGLAAMTMALAHSRGWLDFDEPVCKYWPEFAQNAKENITVRQLLAHQAGLFALDDSVDKETVANLDRLSEALARQTPAWEPGTRQAYHAISLGFYESELLRRIDPKHRSLGLFFQEEIATPLGLDLYIRLPRSIPNSRLAVIEPMRFTEMLFRLPLKFTLATMNRHSNIYRALAINPGSSIVHDDETIYSRDLEVPSGGGVGTARSIAKAYGVFATGGKEIGLTRETLDELMAPPVPSANGFYDECILGEARFSLGFAKPGKDMNFATPSAFGHPGAGGSMGFADPENGIGYAYVTNRLGVELTGDPRELALRDALYSALATSPASTKTLSAVAR